ncbi:hypothetical protein M2137_002573 [Parabacteroides sp. PFB2-10]|uniref:DUF5020 family protein n=1 Tax=Parabacteroides sp. PFB2-10 TaxID=1742405 RepID=UPI002476B753|nr:DUF5020 family protein [Parabacteroides sp. PFB2-10]MDH6313783.1 hypothetical protein [Parabacteroides sp. PFB2-10]MDL2244884.1 DUF5020 family protein [Parabacteroides sp. OttesenSCG-928-J18]
MKKFFIICSLFLISFVMYSQNLQLHFDPRHGIHGDKISDTNFFTATFEMFKPDKWGSTFLFVDLDFNQSRGNIGTAYMEIARDFSLGKCPIMAHIEFNGGVGNANSFGFSIENAYLVGVSYATNLKGANLSTYLAYKYNAFEKVSNDIQWTATWGINFLNDKLTFAGFLDIWTQNKNKTHAPGESGKEIVLLTEPQLWYNLTEHLALGTEIEISNNFLLRKDKAYINPTIGAKWNF